jgi:HAD superfamily hydrolase (TIGR01662 family)
MAVTSKWICLDVGETLLDETRFWEGWADLLGVPRMTFLAAAGAVVVRKGDHHDVFGVVGRPDWRSHLAEYSHLTGPFRSTDLYPDALPAVAALRDAGYRVAVIANQPANRTAELRALGFNVEVMAMSDEFGAHKPSPEFFVAALRAMGDPDPGDVAYVGDRLDNDVLPSAAAGMHPVWLKRGPWGILINDEPPAGTLVVSSLDELVARIGEAFGVAASAQAS